ERADRGCRPRCRRVRRVRRVRQPGRPPLVLPLPRQRERAPLPAGRGGWRFLHPRYSGRDHRKLMVVDGHAAFVGGYHIGSLYATDWRDTHARLTGDIVSEMQNAFVDFWNLGARHGNKLPDPQRRTWTPNIRVHRNIPRQFVYPIRAVYLDAIDRA